MADYHTFTSTRITTPDFASLLANLRALDATAGVIWFGNEYRVKKNTAWTQPQINAAQNVIDTSPAATDRLAAKNIINNWPIEMRALLYVMLDQINVLRAQHSLSQITPQQVLTAVLNKADTL